MPGADPLRIALILPTAWVFGADMARAIIADAAKHPSWTIHLLRDLPTGRSALLRWLREHPADGALVLPRFSGCVRTVARLVPRTVAICDRPQAGLAQVGIDDQEVGRCAAGHLRATGVATIAYLRNRESWSAARERGVRLGAGGLPVAVFPALADPDIPSRSLGAWLARLPGPVGLFAGNDRCAATALRSCGLARLAVPEQVRVLGADDDTLVCLAERPALSSVRLPWAELGREAARMLAARFAGRPPLGNRLLAPLGVAARASSSPGDAGDALLREARRVIALRVADGLNAGELATALGVSGSTLERRMRAAFGHGPLEAIRRARLALACGMLGHAAPGLAVVARQCGFPSLPAMHLAFRQSYGMGPAQYRRLHR